MVVAMKKALLPGILLLSFSTALALAQTTWNGLRFGMSVKEAQDAMAESKTVMSAPDPLILKSVNDYDLQFANSLYPFPLKVELHFDHVGLTMVILRLDVEELRRRHPTMSSDMFAVGAFSGASYEALHERYGKPLKQQDECDPLDAADITAWQGCSADWSTGSQVIGFVVASLPGAHGAMIQYTPVPKEL
jgi:hypothetical protein